MRVLSTELFSHFTLRVISLLVIQLQFLDYELARVTYFLSFSSFPHKSISLEWKNFNKMERICMIWHGNGGSPYIYINLRDYFAGFLYLYTISNAKWHRDIRMDLWKNSEKSAQQWNHISKQYWLQFLSSIQKWTRMFSDTLTPSFFYEYILYIYYCGI